VIGLDQGQESEGRDRVIIALPGVQNTLIRQVADASKGPVVVVVMTGGPVDISVAKNHPKVNAIVWAGYPGQSGGQAIADVIFGSYNPSGRLPYTICPADYISKLSMFDMNMRANATSGNPGHTYRFYTGTPVYPFGHGLSYSNFTVTMSGPTTVSHARVEKALESWTVTPMREREPLGTVIATVTNNGPVASDFVVLLFQTGTLPSDPLKQLVGFDRVHLGVGQQIQVSFPLDASVFSRVNESGKRVTSAGEWMFTCEGESMTIVSA